jgi:hypothetical protein
LLQRQQRRVVLLFLQLLVLGLFLQLGLLPLESLCLLHPVLQSEFQLGQVVKKQGLDLLAFVAEYLSVNGQDLDQRLLVQDLGTCAVH